MLAHDGQISGRNMATLPSRLQQRARDHLAEALYRITEAARLDGKGKLDQPDLADLARLIGRSRRHSASIRSWPGALELKAKGVGLTSERAELITLMDIDLAPLNMLLLDDDEFKDLVARMDEELGGP